MLTVWLALAAARGQAAAPTPSPPPSAPGADRDQLAQLLVIRRVYVDRLNGGETAVQMRDMIIGSLERSKLFVITENQERADAILRGSAEDLIFTDTFSASEGVNVRTTRLGTVREGVSAGAGVGENESLHTQERKHEATASVRLVSKDGDVIWSATEESFGGKFRGSSADVAERITRQLLSDYERARRAQGDPGK